MRARIVSLALSSVVPIAVAILCATSSPAAAVTVPPAWAGIWSVADSTYNGTTLVWTSAWLDTLCTGEEFNYPIRFDQGPPPDGTTSDPSNSSGTVTDTGLQLHEYNSANGVDWITSDMTWVRSGESATVNELVQYFVPTHQGTIVTTRTRRGVRQRIAPDNVCAPVPVRSRSWGKLKLLYR